MERGTLLNNRYRIVEILGQGGMGSVYRAIDENLGVEVAVKENLFTTEEYARQFRREAIILASLRHTNLPRVTDHFVIENQGQYLVMDYIEGEDLRQRMDRIGVITEEEAVVIGAATCDALNFLDSRTQPIVHRDIKPGNIKITPQGHIYLVDFGLAKIFEGSHMTTTGARAMTPGYSPPEQYGTARTDHRSDIFSLGATLYAALTGSIPEDALARAMDQVELTTVRKRNPKISKRMAMVLERALEVRPDDRYQSAEEFKQALLSVRGISRRRAGEFAVPPPPMAAGEVLEAEKRIPSSPVPGKPAESYEAMPLPVSTPIRDSAPRPRSRPRRRKGGMLWALGLFALLSLGMALVFTYDLGNSAALLNRLIPGVLPIPPTRTEAATLPSRTVVLDATPTLAPTATATATLQPATTATLPVPAVVPPTATPTLVPTQQGGSGGWIAYASDKEGDTQIWVMDLAGKVDKRITSITGGACQPDWSPDGTQLVFISPCDRNQPLYPGSGLFLIHLGEDGDPLDGPSLLTSGFGGDFDPAWSPDGKKIAYTSMQNGGRPQIYVMDLANLGAAPVLLSEKYYYDSQPTWSKDGQKIAFISNRSGTAQIWTMNADGTQQQVFSKSGTKINSNPDWSLDGQRILFTQVVAQGDIPKLAMASYAEGVYSEFQLPLDLLPAREAHYSPDGSLLIFESWPQGGNHEIYITAANGAGSQPLITSPRTEFDAAWKPGPLQP